MINDEYFEITQDQDEWVTYFKNIAHQVKLKSKDKKAHIGVVLVGENKQIISTGYNSFPRGIDDDVDERQERPEKYYWFEHAERNAIYNAALSGVSTKGSTMYMTCGMPCSDCARGIINAGISEIWIEKGVSIPLSDRKSKTSGGTGDLWKEHAKRSERMFEEANVKVNYYV